MKSIKWSHLGHLTGEIILFILLLMDVRTILTQHGRTMLMQHSDDISDSPPLDETSDSTAYEEDGSGETQLTRNGTKQYLNLQYKSRGVLRQYLIRHRIIPEVLAVAPVYLMEVRYTRRCVINLGNKIDPSLLQKKPRQLIWPASNESLYTLVLVDADVPSRANRRFSQRQHWIVINIPGLAIWKGDQVTEYMGPLAPPHTGLHRYVFAAFKQYGRIEYEGPLIKAHTDKLSEHRLYFNMRNFSSKYKLRDPIAVNFYLSGWPLDQFVPEMVLSTSRPSWFVTKEHESSSDDNEE